MYRRTARTQSTDILGFKFPFALEIATAAVFIILML